jgi:hypothetical protein
MRIWSLHPKYLDAKGLVALWRETLLAKHVLEGRTKGYKNHPQLHRFKNSPAPVEAINVYLAVIHEEACRRQYNFDCSKFTRYESPLSITVTSGQVKYELDHLRKKLKERDPLKFKEIEKIRKFDVHPLFSIVKGGVEEWEVVNGEG